MSGNKKALNCSMNKGMNKYYNLKVKFLSNLININLLY